jgi:hypothetical protein
MKARLTILLTASLALLSTLPSAAQASTRAPVIVTAASIDDAADAHPFHPDVQITVTGVESATIEASEPDHTCAAGADGHSVWFETQLMPGTLTLDTSGSSFTLSSGTSSDTVISVYVWDEGGNLASIACNDNGAGAGVLNVFNIMLAGTYTVQVSAAPGVAVTGASEVKLSANYTAALPVSNDEPDGARKLKIPSLPTIINIGSAKTPLDEPVDPLLVGATVTNTVWFKFTYSERRLFGVANFYTVAGDMWFSLFQNSGASYVPVSEVISVSPNGLTALLEPGTYYLRVGMTDAPAGSTAPFVTFTALAILNHPNFQFAAPGTEGSAGATADLSGWTAKNVTAGAGGDTVFCNGATQYLCGYRFTSAGATEATQIKSTVVLNAVKLKKGDLMTLQAQLMGSIGTPNLKVTLKLVDAAGAIQKFTLNVTSSQAVPPALIAYIPAAFVPVKAMLTFKNKDTVAGNSVEIDSVIAGALRTGDGALRGEMLRLPLGGDLSAAWAEAASMTPKGVLPVPQAPPAQ